MFPSFLKYRCCHILNTQWFHAMFGWLAVMDGGNPGDFFLSSPPHVAMNVEWCLNWSLSKHSYKRTRTESHPPFHSCLQSNHYAAFSINVSSMRNFILSQSSIPLSSHLVWVNSRASFHSYFITILVFILGWVIILHEFKKEKNAIYITLLVFRFELNRQREVDVWLKN